MYLTMSFKKVFATAGVCLSIQITRNIYRDLFKQKKLTFIPLNWRPKKRDDVIQNLKKIKYDILIIGGGISGAGCCLDASTRNLKVALIEKDDFASGTSSKSSKLLHGGIRYLGKVFNNFSFQQLKFVTQAITERHNIMKMVPHTSDSIKLMVPVYNVFLVPYYLLGLKFYNFLSLNKSLGPSFFMNKEQTLNEFPNLTNKRLKGSVVYYDGVHSDSRTTLSVLLTSSYYGADIINYCTLEKFEQADNFVKYAIVRNKLTNERFKIEAKVFLSTVGPFTDEIRKKVNLNENILSPSSGAHIVLPKKFGPKKMGFVNPHTDDGRILFFIPFMKNIIVGSTDRSCKSPRSVTPEKKEISYLLRESKKYLDVHTKLSSKDILSVWRGIRPLIKEIGNNSSEDLLRTHVLKREKYNFYNLSGGKFTTFREMAEESIDEIVKDFNFKAFSCKTKNLKMIGSQNYSKNLYQNISKELNISKEHAKFISKSYGDRSSILKNFLTNNKPFKFISKKYFLTEEDIKYQIDYEYALKPGDILLRRSGIAQLDVKRAYNILDPVLSIMKSELNWSKKKLNYEKAEALKELNTMGLFLKKKN